MNLWLLNLDGALSPQKALAERYRYSEFDLRHWGPRLRLACRFGRYRRFERDLNAILGEADAEPCCTLYGSGDFHHVSLALVRRITTPFNLLVLDNHPDWVAGVPFLHCGTWLYHAARHPAVQRIFHVGGDVDFDNRYRFLAPKDHLRSGKIVVFPACRTFQAGFWNDIPHEPLRPRLGTPLTLRRLAELLAPFGPELRKHPLYISLDKDVLRLAEAVVNWDSGHLTLTELGMTWQAFVRAAEGNLAGVDIVGDWSPVKTHGLFRRLLHWLEHPSLRVDPDQAAQRNQATNLAILGWLNISS